MSVKNFSFYPLRQLMYLESSEKVYKCAALSLGKYISHKFDNIVFDENLDNLFKLLAKWSDESETFSIVKFVYKWNEDIEVEKNTFRDEFICYGGVYLRNEDNGLEKYLYFQFLMKVKPKKMREIIFCKTQDKNDQFLVDYMLPILKNVFAAIPIRPDVKYYFRTVLSIGFNLPKRDTFYTIIDYCYKWNDDNLQIRKELATDEIVIYGDLLAVDEIIGEQGKEEILSFQFLVKQTCRFKQRSVKEQIRRGKEENKRKINALKYPITGEL
jgi:hypothetical protein